MVYELLLLSLPASISRSPCDKVEIGAEVPAAHTAGSGSGREVGGDVTESGKAEGDSRR